MNGLQTYYEIHGRGQPFILLHGGAGVADMLGGVLNTLAEGRQVVAAGSAIGIPGRGGQAATNA